MIHIHFSEPSFRMKTEGEKQFVFDRIRKTWILMTDEEWVRQNIVQYLTQTLNYPQSLIAIEKEIKLNELKKRFDILVYDQQHKPWMLVECKASSISLSEDVLQQVLRYNLSVPVEYIVITNGTSTMGWRKKGTDLHSLSSLPRWAATT